MSQSNKKRPTRTPEGEKKQAAREARLAEALRANLKRRKAAQKSHTETKDSSPRGDFL